MGYFCVYEGEDRSIDIVNKIASRLASKAAVTMFIFTNSRTSRKVLVVDHHPDVGWETLPPKTIIGVYSSADALLEAMMPYVRMLQGGR